MSISQAIAARRQALVDTMIDANDPETGTEEGTRQFIVGYVQLLSAAADGDMGPRDEYLETVIPAIRDGGMPLGVVMDGMVRVATVAGAVLGAEHVRWLADFQGEYTKKIIEMWSKG